MTNRQMIMLKLIQLSDEAFADLMDDQIADLMKGGLCNICMANHGGKCPDETGDWNECQFDLVEWLQKQAS